MSRCKIVIPARLASTRLPEKLLLRVGGKSVLQHTHDAASSSRLADGVVIAVDDPRLAEEVDAFGGEWVMTSPDCASGTDRVAEVASQLNHEIFVNVQGDEPEIDPNTIDLVCQALIDQPDAEMATAGTPIRDPSLLNDPACVKIVQGQRGRAVYFSRSPVPYVRDGLSPEILQSEPPVFWQHIGLYAYRRDFLDWFSRQPPSPLEQTERLEQLRAVEAEKPIVVARVDSAAPGIDTLDDFRAFEKRMA